MSVAEVAANSVCNHIVNRNASKDSCNVVPMPFLLLPGNMCWVVVSQAKKPWERLAREKYSPYVSAVVITKEIKMNSSE